MFTPKWKKDAMLLVKGAKKFVHYKRDLLKPDRIDEIESRRQDLLAAIKAKDLEKVTAASKQLRGTCENSLKGQREVSWWEENVEVMFVAIVIALGLRTYVLQPFRIPTGSMQPTLNGIVGRPLPKDQWPAFPKQMVDWGLKGRSYVKEVCNSSQRLVVYKYQGRWQTPALQDLQYMHFFSRSQLRFEDGSAMRLPAPATQIYEAGFSDLIEKCVPNAELVPEETKVVVTIPANSVICEGTIDAGDLVLVDRISYHFRKPDRGEVFVFDTRGITGTKGAGGDQADGSHYIKRLAAVPGDRLSISPPNVLINGLIAREPGFENVYQLPLFGAKPGTKGYAFANPRASALLRTAADHIDLKNETAEPGMREYCALGDNSGNSLDSRYWGTVKEYNLVGPAFVSLWPITTGHWGLIR